MIITTLAEADGRQYRATGEVVGDPGLGVIDVLSVVRHGRRIGRHHAHYGAACHALYRELDRQLKNQIIRGVSLYQQQQHQEVSPCLRAFS